MTVQSFADFLEEVQRHKELRGMNLHRVFYYDAPPLQGTQQRPLQGGEQDFGNSALASINNRLLHGLAYLPHVALRLGELVFRGWHVRQDLLQDDSRSSLEITSEDLSPVIHQRGVDIRLGLDIASLALKRIVEVIILVAGDSDFVPVMKFARREGCQLYLMNLGHQVKSSLYEHSDLVLKLQPSAPQPGYNPSGSQRYEHA